MRHSLSGKCPCPLVCLGTLRLSSNIIISGRSVLTPISQGPGPSHQPVGRWVGSRLQSDLQGGGGGEPPWARAWVFFVLGPTCVAQSRGLVAVGGMKEVGREQGYVSPGKATDVDRPISQGPGAAWTSLQHHPTESQKVTFPSQRLGAEWSGGRVAARCGWDPEVTLRPCVGPLRTQGTVLMWVWLSAQPGKRQGLVGGASLSASQPRMAHPLLGHPCGLEPFFCTGFSCGVLSGTQRT